MDIKKRWIEVLYSSARGTRKKRNLLTPVGGIIYGILIFSVVALGLAADNIFGLKKVIFYPYTLIFSLPLFLIALFLIGWTVSTFIKAKGTPVPFNPPPVLVKSGPYAYTRNPMLAGVFILQFAFGVLYGSASVFLIFTPLFILINYWEIKSIEEPELLKRLGNDYEEYRSETPVFFPNIKRIFKEKSP